MARAARLDITARIVAEAMRQNLGQTFVVENKPGALAFSPSRKSVSCARRWLHAAGRQRLDQRHHAGDRAGKIKINYDRDVVPVTNLIDVPPSWS